MRFGGLGIHSMVEMNMVLHIKWIWRYLKGKERLWRRVVDAWRGRLVDNASWRKISLDVGKFFHCVKWKLDRRDKIRF